MPYLVVDRIGVEVIFQDKPIRYSDSVWDVGSFGIQDRVYLPEGTIAKLIGRSLTWKDDPVEI